MKDIPMRAIQSVAIFILSSVVFAEETASPMVIEAVISFYAGNAPAHNEWYTDHSNIGVIRYALPTGETIESLRAKVSVRISQNGSQAGAMVQFPNTMFGIPLLKVDGDWKIDPKFLIAEIDAQNALSIKRLLYFALVHDEDKLKRTIANPDNAGKFIIGEKPPGGDVDILGDVISNVVAVRVPIGKKYADGGKILTNVDMGCESGRLLYSVLYGDTDVPFTFVLKNGKWAIDDGFALSRVLGIRKTQMP